MSGLIGSIEPFTSTDAAEWRTYLSRVDQFYKANNIADNRKKSVFLSVIGAGTFALAETLLAPAKLDSKTLVDIQEALENHFTPKRIIIAERYKFMMRAQQPGESYMEFIAELRRLAQYCDFGATLNDSLRDRFVCGIRDVSVCKRLLSEDGLTLEKALQIASAQEAVERDAKEVKKETSASSQVFAVRSQPPSQPAKKGECYRCGSKDHYASACKHKSAKCNVCHKKGHLARVCRGKADHSAAKEIKFVSQSSISAVEVPSKKGHSSTSAAEVHMTVNGTPMPFVVDTGAAVTIMSEATWKLHAGDRQLERPKQVLETYTGEVLSIVGETTVDVVYNHQTCSALPLIVVTGDGPTLLGRDWLRVIRLDWHSIFVVKRDQEVEELLSEFEALFSDSVGKLKGVTATVQLKEDAKPVFCRPRSVPYAVREPIEKELDKMVADGVAEKVSHSDWATPVVAVPKPDGSVRLCGDYKVTVNPSLQVDQHPLPKPQDIYATLNGGKVFSKLDLSKAYQQVELDEESQHIITITTHKGLYRMYRLPFGIASAPAIFQSIMDKLLAGIPGVCVYLDDILISAPDHATHCERLRMVLRRLQDAGLRLKRSKCVWLSDHVEYLGFVVDANGRHATTAKVDAVLKAPEPTNVSELRSFLGLVSYYRQFIDNLATIAHPLNRLLEKSAKWQWSSQAQAAFEKLKKLLSEAPVLAHYDPSQPIYLACDASGTGVGAVLSHVTPEGERPVAFASQSLTKTQQQYSQLEREAYGIIFGVTKFHDFLYGRKFVLITDNQPLAVIFGPKRAIPNIAAMRLQRWAVTLAAFDYTVQRKSTKDNANADCMSRLSLASQPEPACEVFQIISERQQSLPIRAEGIAAATREDQVLSKVLSYVTNGWPQNVASSLAPFKKISEELTSINGCLQRGDRTVIPSACRERLLQELHVSHSGMVRMKAVARAHMWWPGIDSDVEQLVRECQPCQMHRNDEKKDPVTSWPQPSESFERVHIDFAGPLEGSMYLIVVDAYSKWLEVIPMASATTTAATVRALRKLFSQFGFPKALVSDNGPQFSSAEFQSFMSANGIVHMTSAPYFPATNGLAERAVQTFKQAVVKEKRGTSSMSEAMEEFLHQYRITPHTTTGVSPAKLFLGREIRSRLNLLKPEDVPKARTASTTASPDKFPVGDKVHVRMYNKQYSWARGVVETVYGSRSREVRLENGLVTRRHFNQMRKRQDSLPVTTEARVSTSSTVTPRRSGRDRRPATRMNI